MRFILESSHPTMPVGRKAVGMIPFAHWLLLGNPETIQPTTAKKYTVHGFNYVSELLSWKNSAKKTADVIPSIFMGHLIDPASSHKTAITRQPSHEYEPKFEKLVPTTLFKGPNQSWNLPNEFKGQIDVWEIIAQMMLLPKDEGKHSQAIGLRFLQKHDKTWNSIRSSSIYGCANTPR